MIYTFEGIEKPKMCEHFEWWTVFVNILSVNVFVNDWTLILEDQNDKDLTKILTKIFWALEPLECLEFKFVSNPELSHW